MPLEDYVFSDQTSGPGVSPGLFGSLVMVGALAPVVVITLLSIYATVVALTAKAERSERARAVLRHLLDALCALCRCRRNSK